MEVLQRMSDKLDAARLYVESINREESLLDFEETQFPLLQTMFQTKDPYDKLWTTALSFTSKNDEWMHGMHRMSVCLSVCLSHFSYFSILLFCQDF